MEGRALKNKKVALALLLIGLTIMSMSLIGYTEAGEEDPGIPVLIRAHGIAVAPTEEEDLILMPVHLIIRGLLFRPIKVGNFSIAPLAIRDGVLDINKTRYNITRGKGALVLEKHDITLAANGTSPSGAKISLRLIGKWFRLPDGTVFLMTMKGTIKFEDDGKLLLLMRAIAFPRQPRPR